MNIVLCAAEIFPFVKTGGLADVCGALALALEEKDVNIILSLPWYKTIDLNQKTVKKINENIYEASLGRNIRVFLVKNDKFFDRDGLYGDEKGDYPDNLDRFCFYCDETLKLLKAIDYKADIIHCHDWQAALTPVFLRTKYNKDPFYTNMKSILTIHNLAYQGLFPKGQFPRLGLSKKLFSENGLAFHDQIGLLKGGIILSDCTSTVSPRYAKEIQEKELGYGLDHVLCERKEAIPGILNGIDYTIWNPKTDDLIEQKYSAENYEDKYVNKQKLQQIAQLPVNKNIPVFGFVGRLVAQKGLDYIIGIADKIAELDMQVVFLGLGEDKYQDFLQKHVKKYPKKIAAFLEFDEQKAHLIYAGSDIFLMPSVFEPCGLSQMISLKYGTIPLVSQRGGLADTIKPFDVPQGNGFIMPDNTKEALLETMNVAIETFRQKKVFTDLVRRAFDFDFSWEKPAIAYKELYQECLS